MHCKIYINKLIYFLFIYAFELNFRTLICPPETFDIDNIEKVTIIDIFNALKW